MIDEVLDGRYEVTSNLGRGGSAVVFRAHDLRLKRDVAVKMLTAESSDVGFLERLQHESECMAGFNHPNIVTVHDVGEHDGVPFIVMELVEGKPLLDLAVSGPMTPEQVCALLAPVCRAMAYSHENDILHRDLTLRNIMVEDASAERPVVKVLDFGIAKVMTRDTDATQHMMGTPSYMPPEHVLGQPLDRRSDVFSFGVCMFRLLNGYFPFEAEHPSAVLYKITREEPREFLPGVPPSLRQVTLTCLAKDPNERTHDFGDLAGVLEGMVTQGFSHTVHETLVDAKARPSTARLHQLNPYLNRVMIKNTADFVGREREIRRIYSRLDAPDPQSISVVGERRIGKSSLLNFIYNRTNRRKYMSHYKDTIFVYLDFQSSADFTVPKFIDFLYNVLRFEGRASVKLSDFANGLDWLKESVRALHESGRRLILLLDEFERITRNPSFDSDFFSFLRSLANGYRVAYVTSSCDELQNMCHNKDISDSPFFNIFSNLPLRPFVPEDAHKLIEVPSAAAGVPLAEHTDALLELSGYFPFYLQIACSCLYDHLAENKGGDVDWDVVTHAFLDEVQPHFEFMWSQFGDVEKQNLRSIASGGKVSRKSEYVNEDLERRGYLLRDGEGMVVFSRCFRDFIVGQGRNGKGSGKRFPFAFWKRDG